MSVYWLTFRIHDDAGYEHRYNALTGTVQAMSSRWWTEATSFLLFESAHNLDQVAAKVKVAVGPSDLVLIGMPEFKDARVIGPVKDQDLFTLMPFTKKA
jgi:hypothetical protein